MKGNMTNITLADIDEKVNIAYVHEKDIVRIITEDTGPGFFRKPISIELTSYQLDKIAKTVYALRLCESARIGEKEEGR